MTISNGSILPTQLDLSTRRGLIATVRDRSHLRPLAHQVGHERHGAVLRIFRDRAGIEATVPRALIDRGEPARVVARVRVAVVDGLHPAQRRSTLDRSDP